MFKHLTRIATTQLKSNLALKIRASKVALTQQRYMMFSSFQVSTEQSQAHQTQSAGDRSSVIQDYELEDHDITQYKKLILTNQEIKKKHPSEYGVPEGREALDYYSKITPTQVMLFNLPNSITEMQITELCQVKGVDVMKVTLTQALCNERFAFAKVDVASPKQVKALKDKFRNFWVEDKKIKLKAREDLHYESYDHRTLIVQEFPNNFKSHDLIDMFKGFGAVVSIELPLKNLAIEALTKNKTDAFVKEKRAKQEQEFRRAQQIVSDSISNNVEYKLLLEKYLGQEQAEQILLSYQPQLQKDTITNQFTLLDSQRQFSITNILTHLQSESVEVQKVKEALLKLKSTTEEENNLPSLSNAASTNWAEQLEQNKGLLKNSISYLRQNRDSIDEQTLSHLNKLINLDSTEQSVDPIDQLAQLSRKELAFAYDSLLSCLEQREELIADRIKQQVNHLGIEERILFQGKDWSKEQEDLKNFLDPFNTTMKIEEVLSVTEQVNNVIDFKNMTPEERFYRFTTDKFNPFLEANFNIEQLRMADNQKLDQFRNPIKLPDIKKPPTINKLLFEGSEFSEVASKHIENSVEHLRGNFDLPFDEIFHKEKKLIDQIIQAEKSLKDKEDVLPDPMGEDRLIEIEDIPTEILDSNLAYEHQFQKDQKKQRDKLFKNSVETGDSKYQFQVNDKNNAEEMLEKGIISQKDFDNLNLLKAEASEVNLGYAFVTFSHSDEAKMALIMGKDMLVEGYELDVKLKNSKIDHKDFDTRYKMNSQRNNEKLVKELEDLRLARKELRGFEENIDKELPSAKKLKDFREIARSTLEDKKGVTREGYRRTAEEEELLNQKIRELEKQNPNMDYTQLFDTDRAEQARKNSHKKALESYKAYSFLKHGVEFQKGKVKDAKQDKSKSSNNLQTVDPYNFPPVEETVAMFLTKDKYPQVLDSGDSLNKPGRKFGYTEQDFIEAYFGKDYARNANFELEQNQVFGFNDSLKNKYPIDKYKQTPILEAKRKQIQDKLDIHPDLSEVQDKNYLDFINNLDTERSFEKMEQYQDTPHPTEPGRSMLKDAQTRLEAYMKRREHMATPLWNTKDIGKIKKLLREEYYPHLKKVPKPVKEAEPAADTKAEEKFEPFYEGEETAANKDEQPTQESNEPEVVIEKASKPQQQQSKPRKTERPVKKVVEEEEKVYFNAVKEKIEIKGEYPSSQEQKEMNRDFVYDYKYRKRVDEEFDPKKEPIHTQRMQDAAKVNKMQPEELFDDMKDWGNISGQKRHGGVMSEKERLGLLQDDLDVQGREPQQQNLRDFVEETQELSEREDEDIYAHYMDQMKKAKLEEAKRSTSNLTQDQKLAEEKLKDLDNIFPEMPRFEGFFKSQREGKHPFEEEQFQFQEKDNAKQIQESEEQYDEELHKRELQGRLMGETLTPRQFALLYNAKMDEPSQVQFVKDEERKSFIDSRDMVRFIEEQKESARRRMVLKGEATEEESHKKILEIGGQAQENISAKEQTKIKREFKELREFFLQTQNPMRLFEKEYIFDEGLGQSANDHIQNIKKEFPGIDVQIRRDRDGYAVIKTQYKPKYKYDLNEIEKYDPKGQMNTVKESLESILKTVFAKETGNDLQNMDKQQLQDKLMMMMQNKDDEVNSQYELAERSKQALSKLWKERVQGQYKNDSEGFARAFIELSENAEYDKTKKIPSNQLFAQAYDPSKLVNELHQDRHLIARELSQQLMFRVKEHMYFKDRKPQDFVKPRRSEQSLFDSQLQNQQNTIKYLEQDIAEKDADKDQMFDKEEYHKIKNEIKKRREAKERLLHQGFPELKSYIRI